MAVPRWAIFIGVIAFVIAAIAFIMIVVVYAKPSVINRDTTTTVKPTTSSLPRGDSNRGGSMGSNQPTPVPEGKPGTGGGGQGSGSSGSLAQKSQPDKDAEKIYLFGIGSDWRPFEYIDEATGEVRGLHKDFTNAVCERMKKRCDFYVSDMQSMWDNSRQHSRGLWDNWFDGSLSWSHTPERLRTYAFLGNLFHVHTFGLFVSKTSAILSVDPDNYKIGFRNSWAANPLCLKRELSWNVKEVTMYDSFEDMKMAVKNGDVDVVLLELPVPESDGLRQLNNAIDCVKGGYSLMVRKDSRTDMAWFEQGANAFVKTNEYKQLCYVAKKIHGGDPRCYT